MKADVSSITGCDKDQLTEGASSCVFEKRIMR